MELFQNLDETVETVFAFRGDHRQGCGERPLLGGTLDLMDKGIGCQAQRPEDSRIQQTVISEHQTSNVAHVRRVRCAGDFLRATEIVDGHFQGTQLGIQKLREILQFAPFQHGVFQKLVPRVVQPQLHRIAIAGLRRSRGAQAAEAGHDETLAPNGQTHPLMVQRDLVSALQLGCVAGCQVVQLIHGLRVGCTQGVGRALGAQTQLFGDRFVEQGPAAGGHQLVNDALDGSLQCIR
mmetsp:Transcript_57703/g.126335  ORF Transcript_57703/g.126335 Transcript_57703/m.126335 type:complete len:236 (-) Transcript_57703:1092-1799(-)